MNLPNEDLIITLPAIDNSNYLNIKIRGTQGEAGNWSFWKLLIVDFNNLEVYFQECPTSREITRLSEFAALMRVSPLPCYTNNHEQMTFNYKGKKMKAAEYFNLVETFTYDLAFRGDIRVEAINKEKAREVALTKLKECLGKDASNIKVALF